MTRGLGPTKYNQNISKGISVRADTNSIKKKKKQREIIPTVRKPELPFLSIRRCLVLFYSSTKYHKIYQRAFHLLSGHRINAHSVSNITKTDNSEVRKLELSILYKTRCLVQFYISTKYHKIFQRVLDLQSGQEIDAQSLSNITQGDNAEK